MPRRMQQALENDKRNPKRAPEPEFNFQPMVGDLKTAADFKVMQDRFAM